MGISKLLAMWPAAVLTVAGFTTPVFAQDTQVPFVRSEPIPHAKTKSKVAITEPTSNTYSQSRIGMSVLNLSDASKTRVSTSELPPIAKNEPGIIDSAPTTGPQDSLKINRASFAKSLPRIARSEPIPPLDKKSKLPAVIIRPSVHNAKDLNDCVVEIKPSEYSRDEVTLKIMVPDSVNMIEVVPNRDSMSTRNFRVQVDNQSSHRGTVRVSDRRMGLDTQTPTGQSSNGFKRNPYFPRMASRPTPSRNSEVVLASTKETPSSKQVQVAVYTPAPVVESEEVVQLPKETTFEGPAHMAIGETGDFILTIPILTIPNSSTSDTIEVELGVTDGLEIVVVDREITVDQLNRTINWHLNSADQSGPVTIRFRVKANQEGYFLQKAKIIIDGQVAEMKEVGSVVNPGIDESSAPLLSFEQ